MTHCSLSIKWGCLVLLLSLSIATAIGSVSSNLELFQPHDRYCNLFYRLDSCPEGLVYNSRRQQCDQPQYTDCGTKRILITRPDEQQHPPYPPETGGGITFIGGACPTRYICPKQNDPYERIFLPHSTTCDLFCACINGVPLLYQCHKGLHFSPRTSRCETREQAGCVADIPPEKILPPFTEIDPWRKPDHIAGQCRPKGTCPQYGETLLPHESACNLLCACKDGKSTLYRCPNGLHYNPITRLCDQPSIAGCNNAIPPEKILPPFTEIDPWRRPDLIPGQCRPKGTCPQYGETLLPHESACNLLCACKDGKSTLYRCPNGLHYNSRTRLCDDPSIAGCNNPIPPEKIVPPFTEIDPGRRPDLIPGQCRPKGSCPQYGETLLPHESACDLLCACKNGKSTLYRCPNGLHYNPNTRLCDQPSIAGCNNPIPPEKILPPFTEVDPWRRPGQIAGQCRPKGSCPPYGETLLPHESACNLLCACKDGKSTLYRCPNGLHYNSRTRLCDDPSNAGCNNPIPGGQPVIDEIILILKPEKPNNSTIIGGVCSAMHTCPQNIPSGSFVFLPHLLVCNLFCGCDGKKIQLYACSKGLHFDAVTQECVSPDRAKCNPVPPHNINQNLLPKGNGECLTAQTCPSNEPSDFTIYLPHPTDCKFFCRCEHGTSRLSRCANGLHFNPKSQSCDAPNQELCISTSKIPDVEEVVPGTGTGVVPEQQELCPAEGNCVAGKQDFLPHERSCASYCECVNGIPRLRTCSQGLHFNPRSKKCEAPNTALCQGECAKLERRNATIWTPSTCTTGLSKIGDVCKVKCAEGYQVRGSSMVKCTKQGWDGIIGLTITPSCKTPEEVGVNLIQTVDKFAKGKVNFLFLLDESASLTREEFSSEISFIKAVVSQFPLSSSRTAGVITFSGTSAVDVHMTQTESCKFFGAIDGIKYSSGGTNILLALRTAIQEINTYSPNVKTLVFLITDGEHRGPGYPRQAAKDLKDKGHVLFTIGVGKIRTERLQLLASPGNDGVPLFFGLANFKAFNKIAEYLHTVHGYGTTLNCEIPKIAV